MSSFSTGWQTARRISVAKARSYDITLLDASTCRPIYIGGLWNFVLLQLHYCCFGVLWLPARDRPSLLSAIMSPVGRIPSNHPNELLRNDLICQDSQSQSGLIQPELIIQGSMLHQRSMRQSLTCPFRWMQRVVPQERVQWVCLIDTVRA